MIQICPGSRSCVADEIGVRQAAVSTSQSHDLYPEKKLDRGPGIDHLPDGEEKELTVSVNIFEKRKEPTGLHRMIFPHLLNLLVHSSPQLAKRCGRWWR